MLANVDTISHTVRIMSIPRDLIVTIPGYGRNKINAAYVFGEYYHEPGGGPGLALQTVSKLFDVPIAYYVTLNFDGFRAIVDAVGGVAIDVPYSIDDDAYPDDEEGNPNGTITVHFDAGWQLMDREDGVAVRPNAPREKQMTLRVARDNSRSSWLSGRRRCRWICCLRYLR